MTDWNKNYKSASMIGRNPEIVRDAANAEIERLRAALTRLVAWEGPVELACPELGGLLKAMYDARAALEGKGG